MSAKRSWDVEVKPRAHTQVPEPVAHTPRVRPARTTQKKRPVRPHAGQVIATRPLRTPLPKESLKARRARAKRIFLTLVSVLTLLSVGVLLYLAWLPALRVQTVTAEGPAPEAVSLLTKELLSGTHLFIVPRDSLFFIPESDIRARILETHPEISAVTLQDNGLTGLHVVSIPRARAFVWCGLSKDTSLTTCFDTDPDGLIFAPYAGTEPVASSTLNLRMYAAINGDSDNPVSTHIKQASAIPNALQLARALKSLNANIAEVALRGDEADFYTIGGTRITYVIGREREAAQLAASAFPQLSLNDGSVEYVDLRFDAKVYLRRAGESGQ